MHSEVVCQVCIATHSAPLGGRGGGNSFHAGLGETRVVKAAMCFHGNNALTHTVALRAQSVESEVLRRQSLVLD